MLKRRPVPLSRVLLTAFGVAAVGAAVMTASGVVGIGSAVVGLSVPAVSAVLIAHFWHGPSFGAANSATLARVVGTGWVTALTAETVLADLATTGLVVIVVVGTGCLILDGVDGRLARVRGETSAFGARFDMETDAALLLALSIAVLATGLAGRWVLAIGLMRYGYVAVSKVLPQLRVPLAFSYSRKVVAVIQGVALLACLALRLVPGLPVFPSLALLSGSLVLLCWSFGRDIAWQFRQYDRRRTLIESRLS